mmetsp:Transcript_19975/g.24466  ORF Transcript_19975/g.24466 Transcript_19975/m.24466 type:complete len:107 (-) Transcript_19975:101-421(-)
MGVIPTLIMFPTDDCILLRPLITILHNVTILFPTTHDHTSNLIIAGYLTCLYPSMQYSQTQSRPLPPPVSQMQHFGLMNSGPALVYLLLSKNIDHLEWYYTFDLSP